jgi:hypothetical protein
LCRDEAKKFMEGSEYCEPCSDTAMAGSGISAISYGARGDVDPGQKGAIELFLGEKGKILCHLPDEDTYQELKEGDALLVSPARPPALTNIDKVTAVVVWVQARGKVSRLSEMMPND